VFARRQDIFSTLMAIFVWFLKDREDPRGGLARSRKGYGVYTDRIIIEW